MRNLISFIVAMILFAFIVTLAPACGGNIPSGAEVKAAIIRCTEQQASAVQSLVGTLLPLLSGNSPHTSEAYAIAKAAGKDLGICALAQAVQLVMTNRGTVAGGDTNARFNIATMFEQFRDNEAASSTVEVNLDGRIVHL